MNAYVRNLMLVTSGMLWGMICVSSISWWWAPALLPLLVLAGYLDRLATQDRVDRAYTRGYINGKMDGVSLLSQSLTWKKK